MAYLNQAAQFIVFGADAATHRKNVLWFKGIWIAGSRPATMQISQCQQRLVLQYAQGVSSGQSFTILLGALRMLDFRL